MNRKSEYLVLSSHGNKENVRFKNGDLWGTHFIKSLKVTAKKILDFDHFLSESFRSDTQIVSSSKKSHKNRMPTIFCVA